MTKKDIFHFNLIDKNISEEKLKQIKELYTYYHKITWIYKHSKKKKQKNKLCCEYIKCFARQRMCGLQVV